MNRREMIKSVGALAVVGAVPVTAQAEPIVQRVGRSPLSSRFLRYKKYDEMSKDWKYFKKLDLLSEAIHKRLIIANSSVVNQLIVYGDCFVEILRGRPLWDWTKKDYILPVNTMYRIETTKGKLLEFQQSAVGPDYQALTSNANSSFAMRFKPEEIIHFRVNAADPSVTKEMYKHYEASNRSALPFYPYGYSPMEVWANGKEVDEIKFGHEIEKTLGQLEDLQCE